MKQTIKKKSEVNEESTSLVHADICVEGWIDVIVYMFLVANSCHVWM